MKVLPRSVKTYLKTGNRNCRQPAKIIVAQQRKDKKHLFEALYDHIVRLQRDYFSDLFAPITDTIKTNAVHLKNLVNFPSLCSEYHTIFENCLRQNNIVEYYLCEGSGTSLLIDSDGNSYGFFIRTEEDFQMIQEGHEPFYYQAKSIQNRFLKKEIMFCNDWKFHTFADHKSWPSLFRKSQRVETSRPFYWACDRDLLSTGSEALLSYAQYTKDYYALSQ